MTEVALVRVHDHDPYAAYAHLMAFARSQHVEHEATSRDQEWGDALERAVRSGGFTFHDMVGDGPRSGYMVSTDKRSETRIPVRDLTPEKVADYMSVHQQSLRSPNAYMGGWVYRGFVYLDVSTHVEDREAAMRLARQHNQIAIYDLAKGETVTTEPESRTGSVTPLTDRRPAYVRAGSDVMGFVNALRVEGGAPPMQICSGCGQPYEVGPDGEPIGGQQDLHDHWTAADEAR